MSRPPKKILVVRNDKLGDFVLTYPAFVLLRNSLPSTEIHALVQGYTAPIAKLCFGIDHLIIDNAKPGLNALLVLTRLIRQQNFDAVITLYSTTRIAIATSLARIPYRLAPATKLAQIFYTKRVPQRRSRSEKPEYIYNRDLIETFLADMHLPMGSNGSPPFLAFDNDTLANIRTLFYNRFSIPHDHLLVFIHPGSGGSANNLTPQQYAELALQLESRLPLTIVISTGPGEVETARLLASLLSEVPHIVYISEEGLEKFSQHLAIADLFISGSTGPLHIAGALDRPTVGFYTRRRSATALRWQTLNMPDRRLSFSPPDNAEPEDMQSIDIICCAGIITSTFL